MCEASRTLAWVVVAAMIVGWSTPVDAGLCVTPLKNPAATDPALWSDLIHREPEVSNSEIKRVLWLRNGVGDRINLDFYALTFRKHPNKSLRSVFHDLRQQFSEIVARAGDGKNAFRPYSRDGTSSGTLQNARLWNAANPLEALMTFRLATKTVALGVVTQLAIVAENGDVFVTCGTEEEFVFSTVETNGNTWHPVSGNRGFGVVDNGDSTWTFYTKGADRETFYMMNDVAKLEYIGTHGVDPTVERGDVIFQYGHRFWLDFFASVQRYIAHQGMPIVKFTVNSKRYKYPL